MNIKEIATRILEKLSELEDPNMYQQIIEKELWEGFRVVLNDVFFMRQAQNNYFKIRTEGNLQAAKKLENKIDNLIIELKKQRNPERQKPLFPKA